MRVRTTSYEHLLVLDNVSIFNDLLFQPVTGLRQQRIKLIGFTTFEWNGQLDAQGFILNQDNVEEWEPNREYTIGNIVRFKNVFWSATAKIQPAEEFDFGQWRRVNYDEITKGLLPNLSSKAAQMTDYYNNKTANLESDVDLLALGLIGFRPREGFNALDDISQVNFYSGFIDIKGTRNSTNAFRNVPYDKTIIEYDIFENWAVQQATYGGSSNKTFVDLELEDAVLQDNPTIVEVVNNNSTQVADYQLIKLNKIFKQSEPHTDPNLFPVLADSLTDTNLPIAGHVHLNDIDIHVFELTDLIVDNVVNNSSIWVAKDNAYDWNVYHASAIRNIKSLALVDNKIEIEFYTAHEVLVNDKLVVKQIDTTVNGTHIVENVISATIIRVAGTTSAFNNVASDADIITVDISSYTADNTLGAVFKLTSLRANTPSDLLNPFFTQLPLIGSM